MEFVDEPKCCIELPPIQPPPLLHVGCPNIGDRELFGKLVDQILDRRWFTNGGCVVTELEARLREYLGVKHCITVCNATIGLQLVCRALELSGEVIVPSFTFVASAHAMMWEGVRPVFADVDPKSHCLDLESVTRLIRKQTAAILGVHLWGHPCDTGGLHQIAADHGIPVFYDAAHAFGCSQDGKMIGNFGCCEVFSFHATKFFNTFEGGAITTNNDALALKLRRMRSFGFSGVDQVDQLGTNAKMNEVCAAMGLSMFAALPEILQCNEEHYERYRDQLDGLRGVRLLSFDHLEQCNRQYIVVEIDENEFGVSRDVLMQRLHDNGVMARRYFYPGCHQMEPYRSLSPAQPMDCLANTESLCRRVLCLPTGNALCRADVDRVCGLIRQVATEEARTMRRAAG